MFLGLYSYASYAGARSGQVSHTFLFLTRQSLIMSCSDDYLHRRDECHSRFVMAIRVAFNCHYQMQRSGSTEAVPPRPALCRGQEYEYWALNPRPSHVNSFFSPDALQENISTFDFIHNICRIS
jgi:hypothetical protein